MKLNSQKPRFAPWMNEDKIKFRKRESLITLGSFFFQFWILIVNETDTRVISRSKDEKDHEKWASFFNDKQTWSVELIGGRLLKWSDNSRVVTWVRDGSVRDWDSRRQTINISDSSDSTDDSPEPSRLFFSTSDTNFTFLWQLFQEASLFWDH